MKKGLVAGIIAAVLIVFGGGYYVMNQRTTSASNASDLKTDKKTTQTSKKMLILYYSNSGTTKIAAKKIQKQTGADIVEMKMNPVYPKNYNKLGAFAQHQIDIKARPKITNLPKLAKYDTILLGFPTWFHRPPMFINTFFATAKLKGKTVVPFTTSASSEISESTPYLKKMAKGTGVKLQTGFRANETRTITSYLKQHKLV
ncbi:flavodoxin [Levilactobacillus humaensis]|uniref:flavodoxin n=1 Tax=Levilactobacillus humaensis TaxID=2950375 RepID=UPI0021C3819D|nr:flavodoxin [Levilactobacillus humaensis]